MPILTVEDLYKSFGPQIVLDGVSLSIHSGERVGLVGVNGSGKSTLGRILAGLEPLDRGRIARRRTALIEYLAQEQHFEPELTAHQVVLAGLGAWSPVKARYDEVSAELEQGRGDTEALLAEQSELGGEVERLGGWDREHLVDAMLTRLGVSDVRQSMGSMSGGERRRVALSRILVARPDLAILDEPTNHLDADTIEWLEQHLTNDYSGALLLITHDRYVLDRVAERTLELEHGKVYSYDGGWEDYLTAKAERLALGSRTEANRQNFLRRELSWLARQPKARTGKQKARIRRAETARDSGSKVAPGQEVVLQVATTRLGSTVLELRDLVLELAGRRLIDGLDLHLTRGERIGVVGLNGVGKTSLLRIVLGELTPTAGQVVRGRTTRIAYFDQARSGLDDSASVQQNVAGDSRNVEVGGRSMTIFAYLEKFLFFGDKQRQPVGALSGGERARVALAKLLLGSANVLLLDEPTNDLDVLTLGALEELLLEFAGTALVVTHDRYFLDRVATAVLVFEDEGRVVRYPGGYSSYRVLHAEAARQRARSLVTTTATAEESARRQAPSRRRAGLSYAEKLELESLMDRVGESEARVAELEAALADPGVYAERGEQVPALLEELEASRHTLQQRMERWEELEHKREATGR